MKAKLLKILGVTTVAGTGIANAVAQSGPPS